MKLLFFYKSHDCICENIHDNQVTFGIKFSNVAKYKVNMQVPIVFIYNGKK